MTKRQCKKNGIPWVRKGADIMGLSWRKEKMPPFAKGVFGHFHGRNCQIKIIGLASLKDKLMLQFALHHAFSLYANQAFSIIT